MKSLTSRLLVSLSFVCSGMVYAASDSTSVNIEIIHINYVKFIGSAVGITKTFSADAIKPATNGDPNPTLTIGTLGLESSNPGNCSLDFSSLNGFSLKHSQGNQRLTDYQLDYKSNTIDAANLTVVLPSCNEAATNIDFTAVGNIKKNPRPGLYSDTVSITVTTQ